MTVNTVASIAAAKKAAATKAAAKKAADAAAAKKAAPAKAAAAAKAKTAAAAKAKTDAAAKAKAATAAAAAKKVAQSPAGKAAAAAKAKRTAQINESDAKDIRGPVVNKLPPGVNPAVAQQQLRHAQMARAADIRSKPIAGRPDLASDYSSTMGQMATGPVTAAPLPKARVVGATLPNAGGVPVQAVPTAPAVAPVNTSQGSGTRADPYRGATLNSMRGALFGIPTAGAQTMGGSLPTKTFGTFAKPTAAGALFGGSNPSSWSSFGKAKPGGGMFSTVYNGGSRGGHDSPGYAKGGVVETPTKRAMSTGGIKDPFGYGRK